MAAALNPDTAAAKRLGAALRRVGYTEDGIAGLLGEDAYTEGRAAVPVHERRLPQTKLATAVRLLFLERPVPREDAVRALGAKGVGALAATGLAAVGDDVVPQARITPVNELLLASDGFSHDHDDPPDYVATYTPTSRLCDLLTPRPRVRRALDIGTGNGVHALLAAHHSDHVVATDVNPRALALTELNAALNGLANVECRRGSLLEPVAGETFDLITCNAPYVVSPESRWAYRDSGFDADEVSARLVREAAAHLNDRGFATLLVSWVLRQQEDTNAAALAWVEASGCDGWILPVFGGDPLDHAAGWNEHLSSDRDAYNAAIDQWTDYLDGLGVQWITEGGIVLHKRAGKRSSPRVDVVEPDDLDDAGEQIRRAFANRARLAALTRAELLAAAARPVPALRIEYERRAGGRPTVRVRLDEGTNAVLDAPGDAGDVLAALAAGATIGEAAPRGRQLALVRELLELGGLRLEARSGRRR
ncbi:MAG: methyltransferase [Gaiellaceae bacterium]